MFHAIRKHLSPASVMAFVALVFALTGGAFAAANHSGSPAKATVASTGAKVAKSKAKGKAGPRGPAGPKGATGAAGPAGPAGTQGSAGPTGPAGAAGVKGDTGAAGTNGTNGTNGEGVTVAETGASECDGEKGAKVSSTTGSATVCSGKSGFTSILPEGKTEKGVWAAQGGGGEDVSISFPIPLESSVKAHYIAPGPEEAIYNSTTEQIEFVTPDGACPGSAAEPEAEPNNLCVYLDEHGYNGLQVEAEPEFFYDPENNSSQEAGRTGVVLQMKEVEHSFFRSRGTWAVTAPVKG